MGWIRLYIFLGATFLVRSSAETQCLPDAISEESSWVNGLAPIDHYKLSSEQKIAISSLKRFPEIIRSDKRTRNHQLGLEVSRIRGDLDDSIVSTKTGNDPDDISYELACIRDNELFTGDKLNGHNYIFTLTKRIKSPFYGSTPALPAPSEYDSERTDDKYLDFRDSLSLDYEHKELVIRHDEYGSQKLLGASGEVEDIELSSSSESSENYDFVLGRKFAKGNFGEVWYATGKLKAKKDNQHSTQFVLKRIFCEKGESLRRSGLREVHFGEKLKLNNVTHVSRFVESFNRSSTANDELTQELWLVFYNEGKSLDSLLYEHVPSTITNSEKISSFSYTASAFWFSLRSSVDGNMVRLNLMKQLVSGLQQLSELGIVHRDLKPSNIFISEDSSAEYGLMLRIGDFGSAVDLNHDLYPIHDPANQNQETYDYQPPESRLGLGKINKNFPYDDRLSGIQRCAYDIWSAAVVFLEILLANDRVFEPSETAKKRIRREFELAKRKFRYESDYGSDDFKLIKDQALFIATLREYGIDPFEMSINKMESKLREADPLHQGTSRSESELLLKMLRWDPNLRILANQIIISTQFDMSKFSP